MSIRWVCMCHACSNEASNMPALMELRIRAGLHFFKHRLNESHDGTRGNVSLVVEEGSPEYIE